MKLFSKVGVQKGKRAGIKKVFKEKTGKTLVTKELKDTDRSSMSVYILYFSFFYFQISLRSCRSPIIKFVDLQTSLVVCKKKPDNNDNNSPAVQSVSEGVVELPEKQPHLL